MTLRQFLVNYLVDNMLWPKEAAQIVDQMGEDQPEITERLDDAKEGYPVELLAALLFSAKKAALRWIEANAPAHFAKIILKG